MSFQEDNEHVKSKVLGRINPGEYRSMIVGRTWYSNTEKRGNSMEEQVGPSVFQLLEDNMRLAETKNILEVGCGEANALIELAGIYLDKNFYGIDIAVIKLQYPDIKNLFIDGMDVQRLEYPEAAFDIVFSIVAFPYVTDKLLALSEVYRVLKPGGLAVIEMSPSWMKPDGLQLFPMNPDAEIRYCEYQNSIIIQKRKDGQGIPQLEYLGIEEMGFLPMVKTIYR